MLHNLNYSNEWMMNKSIVNINIAHDFKFSPKKEKKIKHEILHK